HAPRRTTSHENCVIFKGEDGVEARASLRLGFCLQQPQEERSRDDPDLVIQIKSFA
ncbi:hypothetical protein HKBW3S42_02478, partial [Candidatus Hakubella thermalkaliphila]